MGANRAAAIRSQLERSTPKKVRRAMVNHRGQLACNPCGAWRVSLGHGRLLITIGCGRPSRGRRLIVRGRAMRAIGGRGVSRRVDPMAGEDVPHGRLDRLHSHTGSIGRTSRCSRTSLLRDRRNESSDGRPRGELPLSHENCFEDDAATPFRCPPTDRRKTWGKTSILAICSEDLRNPSQPHQLFPVFDNHAGGRFRCNAARAKEPAVGW